jgi:xanthine dehydrogenase accessory factor
LEETSRSIISSFPTLAFLFNYDYLHLKALTTQRFLYFNSGIGLLNLPTVKSIYQTLLEKMPACPAIVTITGTSGSTPQKQGSSAIFGPEGLLAGTIGGGVVENQVAGIIRNTLPLKKSGYYRFDLDKDIRSEEEAICGGQMNILIDTAPEIHRPVFEQLVLSLQQGISGVLITRVIINLDQPVTIKRLWTARNDPRWTSGEQIQEGEDELIFLEQVFPPPRLVIAGAGHIGKALAHLGNLLDFEVTVIDDREEYANSNNIPDADHLVVGNIGRAMEQVTKTPDTYLVILTRGHKDDAEALRACISSGAAYIGMIGSRKKIALMRGKFIAEGWALPEQWEKIHSPIGLDICSKTVQEIAVSIAAQLIQVRNQKSFTHA